MNDYSGGCHCGKVRFRVRAPLTGLTRCNCSMCSMKGIVHWIVPAQAFTLESGADELTSYSFNTGIAKHLFCRTCGTHSFYIPRSDPDKVDVNARCLDSVDPATLEVDPFDGRNWEQSIQGDVPWRR